MGVANLYRLCKLNVLFDFILIIFSNLVPALSLLGISSHLGRIKGNSFEITYSYIPCQNWIGQQNWDTIGFPICIVISGLEFSLWLEFLYSWLDYNLILIWFLFSTSLTWLLQKDSTLYFGPMYLFLSTLTHYWTTVGDIRCGVDHGKTNPMDVQHSSFIVAVVLRLGRM